LLFKKGFWPKGEQRKQLVWTAKAKALFLMAVGLHLLVVVCISFWSVMAAIIIGLLFFTVFGIPYIMSPLQEKLSREAVSGSRAVSYTFKFPSIQVTEKALGNYLYRF
jgi:fatty acid desaturase